MTKVHVYLNFNGECEAAFDFYKKVFKTEIVSSYKFGDMPLDPNAPIGEGDKSKIMHIALKINNNMMLMGSDCLESFGQKATPGTTSYIMLDVESKEEAKELYDALVINAQNLEMALEEQFFAEQFASFIDQYGIGWMIHFEGNKNMS